MFLSIQRGSVLRSGTSTPKSMLAPILGLIPMALVLEPGSEQCTPLACVILGTLTASCMVTVFLVPTAHRLIHRKDVHDDEFEPRSGEVIHA
jgi:Cu/Ag efflux pump CusA